MTRIPEQTPVRCADGAARAWGSFLSMGGAAMRRPWRARPFAKIGLAVGAQVPAAQATPEALQARVAELRGDWR